MASIIGDRVTGSRAMISAASIGMIDSSSLRMAAAPAWAEVWSEAMAARDPAARMAEARLVAT